MKATYTLWKRGLPRFRDYLGHTGETQTFSTWKQLIDAMINNATYYLDGYGWTIERKGETVASTYTLMQFIEECCAHDAPWNGKPFYPGYARFLEYLTMN